MMQANAAAAALPSRTLTGRNEICPCGSGKKFKYCCLSGLRLVEPKAPPTVPGLLEQARNAYTANQFGSAAGMLHNVLQMQPEQPDALHLLGIIAHREGNAAGAVALLQRSIAAAPNNAKFFINFGLIAVDLQHSDQALDLFRHAALLDPNMAEAHFNIGVVLMRKAQLHDAGQCFAQALRLRREYPEALNNLGAIFRQAGNHDASATCFSKAVDCNPSYAAAHSNLGTALSTLGRNTEAIASFLRALTLDPMLVDAYVNLGGVLRRVGSADQAIDISLKALELSPGNYEALLNLGNAYKERGELSLACRAYEQAVTSQPSDPRAYTNLAETLRDQGRIAEAARMYEHCVNMQPGFAIGYSNLLYFHAFTRDNTPQEELAAARGWEKAMLTEAEREQARRDAHRDAGVFTAAQHEGRKLRIGIVSAELGLHAVAEFLQPLLENLDREHFHLTLFPTVGRTGERAQHLRNLADNCISLAGVSDADAVKLIREQKIDVLMDTSGHTTSNRLGIFARRAAPVQCSYIGYWSTTGLTEMDWFISDPDAPNTAEASFSENLWRLPRIAVAYHGDHKLDHTQWQPDPTGTIWLGSFNKYAKIREETLALWARVMKNLPESKLLLEDRGSRDGESQQRILDGLAANGICKCRVEFIPYVPGHERHMLLYNRLDIALDTIPFNSGTTAFDALWMGVPLVALDGDWIGGRMGASVLRTLGRREWIANTPDEYASIVRTLARDMELRKRLRATQRAEMARSELADAVDLTSALESSFLGMYDHWLAGHSR